MFGISGWWTGPEYAGAGLKSVPQRTDVSVEPAHGSLPPLNDFCRWKPNPGLTMPHSFNVFPLRSFAITATTLLAALLITTMPVHATEEPDYQTVQKMGDVEVRAYAAYTVAEVVVPGPANAAGGQAFPILAGYIFGKNKGDQKLAMTAPVTQAPVPVKLEMTAPVTQAAAPGGFVVQFVLPKGVTVANAPEPLDAQIHLREVPARHVAVIRFSGFWSESNYQEHLTQLQSALTGAGLAWTGAAVYSRYNPPFTPWFMRRNEIWLELVQAP
jgi:hypothetical protein